MDRKKTYCYRCDREATSKEHVPPKCLFPDIKDNPTKDFRKNLIKVPSCDVHNTNKSKDDEFIMICLAGSVQINQPGYEHFNSKVKRALNRSGFNLLQKVVKDYQELNIVDLEGRNMKILKGNADIERMTNCFESMIYGLYYHQFNCKFDGEIKILNDFIIPENQNQINLINLVKIAFEKDEKETEILGDNPEIFKYQFTSKDKFGLIALKMTFYEGLNIYASLKSSKAKEPFDIGMALINAGIRTTIAMPNGNFEFNKD